MGRVIRVLLISNQTLVREGLKLLLEREKEFTVAGEVSCGSDVFSIIGSICPDVILLDLLDVNGFNLCQRLAQEHPEIPVIILSASFEECVVLECIKAGAKGYILKNAEPSELIEAIKAVYCGATILDWRVTPYMIKFFRNFKENPNLISILTEEERKIICLVTQGLTNKEIAERLFLSPNTIKYHIRNIMRKLNVNRRAELAFKASKLLLD